ncbi:hypothetical protein J6590_069068 [Homalodisca vitripennis]|nr:hypothetical protein J6590_069068 [Homalodisca vitripennis]
MTILISEPALFKGTNIKENYSMILYAKIYKPLFSWELKLVRSVTKQDKRECVCACVRARVNCVLGTAQLEYLQRCYREETSWVYQHFYTSLHIIPHFTHISDANFDIMVPMSHNNSLLTTADFIDHLIYFLLLHCSEKYQVHNRAPVAPRN